MDPITLVLFLMLFIIPVVAAYQSYSRKKKFALHIDKLPGPKSYPIFGTTFDMLTLPRKGKKNNKERKRVTYLFIEMWRANRKRAKLFSPLFRSWFGSLPVVHMMKPEHLEVI